MDKNKLIESLKWRMEMFAHDIDVIEEERKEGGIGNRYLSGQLVAYTEAFEYLEGLAEDIENGEYDKTGHCPLKSIDDIKAEIEQQLFKNSQVMTNQDARDMSIYNNAILDALKIIDKHCGKAEEEE